MNPELRERLARVLARRFLWLAVWADPMTVTRFVLMAEGETKKRYQLVSHPTNESPTRG